MQGQLLVTPEKLMSTANEFNSIGTGVQSLTQEMLSIVNALKSGWVGEASNTYTSKFNMLDDDMAKMFRMISEHVTDLNEMARNYQMAEQANIETASALAGDVIS